MNNCGACHASTNPSVIAAVANNNTSCTACHPTQHTGRRSLAHYDVYDSGNYGCGWCHGSGCTTVTVLGQPNAVPTTTSDAKSAYEGNATITLTPSDGDTGEFGIKATYYILDGGATMIGEDDHRRGPDERAPPRTRCSSGRPTGAATPRPSKTASFTVSKDLTPPTTTSDAKASYIGPVTIKLTATDGSQAGVANTYYTVDGGAPTSGTDDQHPAARKRDGDPQHHVLVGRCLRQRRDAEACELHGDCGSGRRRRSTAQSSTYYRSAWTSFNFRSNGPGPELWSRELPRVARWSADERVRSL